MLIYDMAVVKDCGTYWEVTGITKNSFDTVLDGEQKYLNLEATAAVILKDALEKNKQVRIDKPLKVNEVLPGELKLLEKDIDELEYFKQASMNKVKSKVRPELSKESAYTMYEFIIKNNELCSKGYFITDTNREEKYIEIIETGDMELIDLLESFLEAKDKVDRAYHLKDKIKKYQESIKDVNTTEEVQKLEDKFIAELFNYIS